jgi:hypothetical protein
MDSKFVELNLVMLNLFQHLLCQREGAMRNDERKLTRTAAATSTPAFAAVWNNPEDDVYDAL